MLPQTLGCATDHDTAFAPAFEFHSCVKNSKKCQSRKVIYYEVSSAWPAVKDWNCAMFVCPTADAKRSAGKRISSDI